MSLDKVIEQVKLAIIHESEGRKFLQSKGLIERLSIVTSLEPLSVRQAMGRLMKAAWLKGVSPDGIPLGRVQIIGEVPVKTIDPDLASWINAMQSENLEQEQINTLSPCYKKLNGLTENDMRLLLQGLLKLKEEQVNYVGQPMFLVSARFLLGSSKLLGELPARNLVNFGINTSLFTNHPPYVVVGGCANPSTVILVENPASFELALKTQAVNTCAFIATFGFGLSNSNSEYGNQLATLAEDKFSSSVTLRREGSSCPDARELLSHPNLTFWGDLDPAGIKIYHRLKHHIPQLKFSALYEPMVEYITSNNNSHPYVNATKKNGQLEMNIAISELDKDASYLYEISKSRGVDQEVVSADLIDKLATQSISIN